VFYPNRGAFDFSTTIAACWAEGAKQNETEFLFTAGGSCDFNVDKPLTLACAATGGEAREWAV
jgi:hypothetical protein